MDNLPILCNLCNSNNTKILFTKDSYNIVKCKKCGLVYVNPQPTKEALSNIYEKDFFFGESYDKRIYKNYLEERSSKNFPKITERCNKLIKLKSQGNLLDVGCAHGFFLDIAKKTWNVKGIEISKYASKYAREKLNLDVTTGTLSDIKLKNHFDIITMWGLIDHVQDPMLTLKQANELMKINGVLTLNIANLDSFRAKFNGINWRPLMPPFHLHFYSLKTIKKMLKKAGFKCIHITGKHEVGIKDIIKNPDFKKIDENYTFKFSKSKWLKLLSYGLFSKIMARISNTHTVGSNFDIYAVKYKDLNNS